MKILVAGVGNVLRGDDGFGVVVAQNLLEANKYGSEVTVFEAGIAGISLVQELMSGYEVLIIVDTVHRGGSPGTIYLVEPEVPKIEENFSNDLHQSLADAHYSDPSKVLILARALNVLPARVFLIGCEPEGYDELGADLSAPVQRAVRVAIEKIESLFKQIHDRSIGRILIGFALCFLLFACAANRQAGNEDELIIGVRADDYVVEPLKSKLGMYPLNVQICEPLVRIAADYGIEPLLATRWERHGNTWRFFL